MSRPTAVKWGNTVCEISRRLVAEHVGGAGIMERNETDIEGFARTGMTATEIIARILRREREGRICRLLGMRAEATD